MATAFKEFTERYRSLADGELLQLALDRQELTSEASNALESELRSRGLGEGAVEELREALRAAVEEEPATLQEEPPSAAELTEDVHQEKSDLPAPSLASFRPKGITVCSFSFWLSGVVGAFISAMVITNSAVTGLLVFAISVLEFVTGRGLWRLRPWSRKMALVMCWTSASLMCVSFVIEAVLTLLGTATEPSVVFMQASGLVWSALWAIYLSSETVKTAFAEAKQLSS